MRRMMTPRMTTMIMSASLVRGRARTPEAANAGAAKGLDIHPTKRAVRMGILSVRIATTLRIARIAKSGMIAKLLRTNKSGRMWGSISDALLLHYLHAPFLFSEERNAKNKHSGTDG
jgi:hypothetical protein